MTTHASMIDAVAALPSRPALRFTGRHTEIPAELVDDIAGVVVPPDHAAQRATVIYQIIEEIIDTVAWRHGYQPHVPELESVAALLASAEEQVNRMMPSRTESSTDDLRVWPDL